MAIHDQSPYANLSVTDEIFIATEWAIWSRSPARKKAGRDFYVGHSGWGARSARKRAGRRVVAGPTGRVASHLRKKAT